MLIDSILQKPIETVDEQPTSIVQPEVSIDDCAITTETHE